MSENFNLHEELVKLQNNDIQIDKEVLLRDMNQTEVEENLDGLVDILQNDASRITLDEPFDATRSYLKYFESLPAPVCAKFVDLLLSVFGDQIQSVHADIAENAQHNFEQDRISLQMYLFSWNWLFDVAESRWRAIKKDNEKAAAMTGSKVKAKSGKGTRDGAREWNWESQRIPALQLLTKVLSLDLPRIMVASSDTEAIISLITRSISLVLEEPDIVKSETTKELLIKILCLCVTRYDQGMSHGLTTRVLDQYLREEHLSEFVAQFMATLVENYDHTKLLDDVLRACMSKEFSDRELKVAKAFAHFIIRLSELQPREVLKHMVYLQGHFDSESYTIRKGLLDVIGNLVQNHLASDSSESAAKTIHVYYEIIQDRFRDVSSYVRVKVLEVLLKLTERSANSAMTNIPIKTRPVLVSLTAGRLHDKASNVRKNAIKLITKFIQTNPFMMVQDDGKLSLHHFESQKTSLEDMIKAKFPNEEFPGMQSNDDEEELASSEKGPSESTEDQMEVAEEKNMFEVREPAQAEPREDVTPPGEQELRNLRNLLKYYKDAIRFVKQIENLIPTMCELLASNAKGEVIEAMNFFMVAHRYQMECAAIGVKKMVHKIWDKDTGESERVSIRDHLIRSYSAIYLDPPPGISNPSAHIADNLIMLTQTMTLAELTSLEQLLTAMGGVEGPILDVLWGIFASKKQAPYRRRGAIVILGMLGKARKEIIADNLETLLHIGLGEPAKRDLMLARYTCSALMQLGSAKRQKGSMSAGFARLPPNHPLFLRMQVLLTEPSKSLEWFGFAEQAINAIYLLSEHPDAICGQIIKDIAGRVLRLSPQVDMSMDMEVDQVAETISEGLHVSEDTTPAYSSDLDLNSCDPHELSTLCFIVGHVVIKQIVHLEAIEAEWKRRKHATGTAKTPKKGSNDDLEAVTGTAEDEFTEAILHIRENTLLFDENSLLGVFGPLVAHICLHNGAFNHQILQTMAVLALSKFMCVSSEFCDNHLQLLFTILEKANDPVIRSNTVIGLGDMTVSFNSLIDQNISYLYKRLNDTDLNVKKNTLMVLTFLILNGMIKVKGQISEMAKCLEDEDQRISDLTKLFFTELSTKDNAVYNNLPDIISNLSHPETGVEEQEFRSIMKFLLDFIKKDKQADNIVDKLCVRFKNSSTERQWRDISYCLSLLSFTSDKSIKKLIEHLPQYQDKLHEPVLYKNLQDIVNKAKKSAKSDTKVMLEEFEATLSQMHETCVENEQSAANATQEQQENEEPLPPPSQDDVMDEDNDSEEEEEDL
ncbi:non-SMC mitotic condensation complex subunit 1-domain-containing protein [Phlyctochytrium arcticum]|nr:non-SMC mitotic condensation complex subunit 1-domain-containing protein [Phlyctochytrium arcticum]